MNRRRSPSPGTTLGTDGRTADREADVALQAWVADGALPPWGAQRAIEFLFVIIAD
jgi:hypothetical protein